MLKGILVLILMYLLAFNLQQNSIDCKIKLLVTIAFLTGLSYLAFMLADITRNILMSLKMTDYSFVSYFVSFFDNSGYRIMCPPISATGSQNKNKIGILAETLAE